MGAVDLQAFLAMFVIFGSLLLHLTGQPFDLSNPKMVLLHQLEVAALSLSWLTFWGGMLFYLGHEQPEIIAPWVKITMSILIVLVNTLFLLFAVFEFVKEFINDYKHKASVKRKTMMKIKNLKSSLTFAIKTHQKQLEQQEEDDVMVNGVSMAARRMDKLPLKLSSEGSTKVFPVGGGEELSYVAIHEVNAENDGVKNWAL